MDAGVYVSALDMFSIGIGPSSSHTVGPMRAGLQFRQELEEAGRWTELSGLHIRLHGSLAATGLGHGTPDAVIAGLRGLDPETCDPREVWGSWDRLAEGDAVGIGMLLLTRSDMTFAPFERGFGHPNALTLTAFQGGSEVLTRTYLSIGGGFISTPGREGTHTALPRSTYTNAAGLIEACGRGRTIADIAFDDEVGLHGPSKALTGIAAIWTAMRECIEEGMRAEGVLPGGLRVFRRAAEAKRALDARGARVSRDEYLAVYAMAINEQNAAGERVVTAPTNGAAGIVPAVLYEYLSEGGGDHDADVRTYLLTAAAIGSIIKANASISGAEAGCQGEVGSACAMAAAGLCALRGGTPEQIENAAEIAMEHHLGLTCDPVGGLVQIPCIERNAIAASTARAAARLALLGDGRHRVSLDTVIETMRQTGNDMSSRYKETSEGGLAVNVVEC